MLQRRKTILVCPFCSSLHSELESKFHGEACEKNPQLESCWTCCNYEDGCCDLKLIPVDFIRKKRMGRNCPSWKEIGNERKPRERRE